MIFVFCFAASLFGQERKVSEPPTMKRADPGPERARLSFLVGNFTTVTQVLPGPMMKKGATGTGTSVISWGLDSMFLSLDEQSINPMLGNYKGHGMLGYDPQLKQYVLSMFNNFGDHPQYRGSFVGDTLVLTTTVPMPGRSFDQKLHWFRDGNLVRLRISNDFGQGLSPVIDQTSTPSSGPTKN